MSSSASFSSRNLYSFVLNAVDLDAEEYGGVSSRQGPFCSYILIQSCLIIPGNICDVIGIVDSLRAQYMKECARSDNKSKNLRNKRRNINNIRNINYLDMLLLSIYIYIYLFIYIYAFISTYLLM